jgi:excinuclease ABC subunit C
VQVPRTFVYPSVVLPFNAELKFEPSPGGSPGEVNDEQFFRMIPSRAGIFLIETRPANDASPSRPYLARTADLRRAAERLLRAPDPASKRLNLRGVAANFRYRVTGSRFEQNLALYQHARARFPRRYRDFLRLRPPALLKVNLRNAYPRCYVTRRILSDGGFYVGPFASRRMAENFSGRFLDLFKVRRCQIKIRRDPSFPGCIYSEMKMCLAPCFAGCTKEEYDTEVAHVVETLQSQGASLIASIERERESASEATDFERAAALHKRLEKVTGVVRGLPEVIRRVDRLSAVILQRAVREKTVAVFAILNGIFAEPLSLCFDELSEPRSVEEILRQHFQQIQSAERVDQLEPCDTIGVRDGADAVGSSAQQLDGDSTQRSEHLSILARWFYSKPRAGEILFRDADWPYRRILRACARVLAATQETA